MKQICVGCNEGIFAGIFYDGLIYCVDCAEEKKLFVVQKNTICFTTHNYEEVTG